MVQSSDIRWEIFLKAKRFSLHFPSTFISAPHKSVLKLPFGYCQREKTFILHFFLHPFTTMRMKFHPFLGLFHVSHWKLFCSTTTVEAAIINCYTPTQSTRIYGFKMSTLFSRSPALQMRAEIKLFFIIFHHQHHKIFIWILVWTSKRLHKLERLKMVSLTRRELTHFHLLKCELRQ